MNAHVAQARQVQRPPAQLLQKKSAVASALAAARPDRTWREMIRTPTFWSGGSRVLPEGRLPARAALGEPGLLVVLLEIDRALQRDGGCDFPAAGIAFQQRQVHNSHQPRVNDM